MDQRPVRVLKALTTYVLPLPMTVFIFDGGCVEAVCRSARDELGTSADYATAPGIIEVDGAEIASSMTQETWLRREHAFQLRIDHLGPVHTWPRKWDRLIVPFEGDAEVLFTVERVFLQEEHVLFLLATYQRPGFITEEEMAQGPSGVAQALTRRDGSTLGILAWGIVQPEPGTPEFDPDDDIHYVTTGTRQFPLRESSVLRVRRDPTKLDGPA